MIVLRPWSEEDLPLVRRYLGDAEMMKFLGGPQGEEEIAAAHRRFLDNATAGTGWIFKVYAHSVVVGSVGYWEREWRDDIVYEAGWSVFPEFQGQGFARAATVLAIERAKNRGMRRFMHAFPSVENVASNAICRATGFELLGAFDFEYPKGHPLRCNDWRLDLGVVSTA